MERDCPPLAESLARLIEERCAVDPRLYAKYGIKRSLREASGEGVPAVLTRISEATGTETRDGKAVPAPGKLFYRGYSIGDIVDNAEKSGAFGFEQAAYLLLFGEIPSARDLSSFNELLGQARALPGGLVEDIILKAPSLDLMNKLAQCVLFSYACDSDAERASIACNISQSMRLMAQIPVMAAYSYQAMRRAFEGKSLYLHSPLPNLSTAENFLRLVRPDKSYNRAEAEMLDLALILHAEGGANNASFIARAVTSTGTDMYSTIGACLCAFKGGRHGGANIRVAEMMDDIKANVSDWSSEREVGEYLRKILRKQAFDRSGLVYGMGHVVFTLSDPRAEILRSKAAKLAGHISCEEEYGLYRAVERSFPDVFREETGKDKPMCANLDFYTACIYSMLGVPRPLFAPLFAVARVAGWCAHRLEELVSGGRIWVPAFKCAEEPREYKGLELRV